MRWLQWLRRRCASVPACGRCGAFNWTKPSSSPCSRCLPLALLGLPGRETWRIRGAEGGVGGAGGKRFHYCTNATSGARGPARPESAHVRRGTDDVPVCRGSPALACTRATEATQTRAALRTLLVVPYPLLSQFAHSVCCLAMLVAGVAWRGGLVASCVHAVN